MLNQTLSATLRILFFQAGPQDFPYDARIARWLIPAAIAASVCYSMLMNSFAASLLLSVVGVLTLGITTQAVLRVRHLEPRFQQTFHSLLATDALLNLMVIPSMSQMVPSINAMIAAASDSSGATQAATQQLIEQPPPLATLVTMVVLIWSAAVSVKIYREAAELRMPFGIAIAIGILIMVKLFGNAVASVVLYLMGLGH